MRKIGVLLALLVLFGTLAVGTGTVKEVRADDCAYFVIIKQDYGTVQTTLNGITWEYYTPIYTLIDLNGTTKVCFPTLKDFTRFLTPYNLQYNNFAFAKEDIMTSVPVTQIHLYMISPATGEQWIQFNVAEITENATVYYFARARGFYFNSGDYGRSYVYHNADVLVSYAPTSTADQTLYADGLLSVSKYDLFKIVQVDSISRDAPRDSLDVFVLGDLAGDFTTSDGDLTGSSYWVYTYHLAYHSVTFSLKDALTGQSLTGVTVKDGDVILGTIDDGGTLNITGTHTLTFEKTGYWSETLTIDVTSDMSVSVEMYPSSAAFKFENFPVNISMPENTIYTLTFTLSPIDTSATYNTYLSLSGLSDILEVQKDGSAISPEGGKYYLGDISGPTQVSIKFKAGAVGQHGFTLTLTSNDAIMSKTYTTTKQVVYKVEPLPFSVQMPSEWQVGQNELRISESSGQSYLITAVLKDSGGNEVWSDSHAFSPYEAYSFQVKIPSEGSYTLELQWNGQTAVYSIQVNPTITLKTKTLTVSKGGEGTIVLHFKNPSSDVQYYTIKVSGGFLPKAINQSISVAPLAEKDVSIAFAVPDKLTYDAYELNVQVLQGNATVFSDKVAVSISDSGGFSLFGGGSNSKTLYYGLAVLIGLGLFVAVLRRR